MTEESDFNDEFDRTAKAETICPVCLGEAEEFGALEEESAGYAVCDKGHIYILERIDNGS